jgi:hypothetical protein
MWAALPQGSATTVMPSPDHGHHDEQRPAHRAHDRAGFDMVLIGYSSSSAEGWPRAHEDDAVRAIHAALEIVSDVN